MPRHGCDLTVANYECVPNVCLGVSGWRFMLFQLVRAVRQILDLELARVSVDIAHYAKLVAVRLRLRAGSRTCNSLVCEHYVSSALLVIHSGRHLGFNVLCRNVCRATTRSCGIHIRGGIQAARLLYGNHRTVVRDIVSTTTRPIPRRSSVIRTALELESDLLPVIILDLDITPVAAIIAAIVPGHCRLAPRAIRAVKAVPQVWGAPFARIIKVNDRIMRILRHSNSERNGKASCFCGNRRRT